MSCTHATLLSVMSTSEEANQTRRSYILTLALEYIILWEPRIWGCSQVGVIALAEVYTTNLFYHTIHCTEHVLSNISIDS